MEKHDKATMQPEGTRNADTKKLQEIMHYHGLEQFKMLLRQAYFNASDEMESLSKFASEEYRDEANKIEE